MVRYHTRVVFTLGQKWCDSKGNDFYLVVSTDVPAASHIKRLQLAGVSQRLQNKCMVMGGRRNLVVEYYPEECRDSSDASRENDVLARSDIVSLALPRYEGCDRLLGIPLEWLFERMVKKSSQYGVPLQAADTWAHSTEVYRYAMEIAEQVSEERLAHATGGQFPGPLLAHILEKGCYAHDFGRMITGSNASCPNEPALVHGFRGAQCLRELAEAPDHHDIAEELEVLARICERHTGGAGLTKVELLANPTVLAQFNIYPADHLAETPYEKIVGYANWRIHPVKRDQTGRSPHLGSVYLPHRVSEQVALARSKRHAKTQQQLKALEDLLDFVYHITDGRVGAGCPAAAKTAARLEELACDAWLYVQRHSSEFPPDRTECALGPFTIMGWGETKRLDVCGQEWEETHHLVVGTKPGRIALEATRLVENWDYDRSGPGQRGCRPEGWAYVVRPTLSDLERLELALATMVPSRPR